MTTHSSALAWKIAWTEEPGRLQSMDKASTPARQAKAVVDNGIQVSQQMLQELNLGDTVPAIQTPK